MGNENATRKPIPFAPPRIDQLIIDEVTEVLKSGWITTGPKTKQFEKELTAYTQSRGVLATSSATAGLELMLRWFGVQEGDEVIVTAYTYCATANVVVHCGAKPVMVDVGPDFNILPGEIEKHITERTKAIMPVDISGWPCDYDTINAIVRKAEIKQKFQSRTAIQEKLGRILVLADSAHSVGAYYKGRPSGSLADVSVFSFHAVKNLSTAEGGAICLNLPDEFNIEEDYALLSTMALHGQNKDARAKMKKGNWRYDIIDAGYKCNMTDIQAAMGLVELRRYESETLPTRKAIFEAYSERFSACNWAQIPDYQSEEKTSSFHVYLLRIKGISEQQRDAIMQEIFDQDVAVNVHFQPLPLLTAYKSRGYKMEDYPAAFDNYSREITLPVYFNLSQEDIQRVADTVIQSVEKILAASNQMA